MLGQSLYTKCFLVHIQNVILCSISEQSGVILGAREREGPGRAAPIPPPAPLILLSATQQEPFRTKSRLHLAL